MSKEDQKKEEKELIKMAEKSAQRVLSKIDKFGSKYEPSKGGEVELALCHGPFIILRVGDFRDIEDETERMARKLFCQYNQVSLTPEEAIEIGEELVRRGKGKIAKPKED